MSMNKSLYLRKKFLDHAFGRAAFTFPTTVWLALFSDDPTNAGLLVNELSGGSYARVSITSLMGDAVLASGQISNNANIAFPVATTDWAPITHAAVVDSSGIGTGNVLYFGPSVTSRIIETTDQFIIEVGQLLLSET